MTPLERASRALYRQGDTGPYGPDDEDAQWHQFIDDVRAVLMAIREPSEAMYTAGDHHCGDDGSASPDRIWPAMIDALLEEGR